MVVQHNQVKIGMNLCQRKRLHAIAGLQDLHLFSQVLQDLAQAFANQGMVIDDEYFQNNALR